MAQDASITIEFGMRWWVRHYVAALVVFARLFCMEPDTERVSRFICRWGVSVRRPA
jgi:hypothetical protein